MQLVQVLDSFCSLALPQMAGAAKPVYDASMTSSPWLTQALIPSSSYFVSWPAMVAELAQRRRLVAHVMPNIISRMYTVTVAMRRTDAAL